MDYKYPKLAATLR